MQKKEGVQHIKDPKWITLVIFIQLLGPDMSLKIRMNLDNPADLIRVCSVSTSWQQFVIANGLCKQLCLKLLPEISAITHTIEDWNALGGIRESMPFWLKPFTL
ncbi:hypothetical protein PTKIN_Ptkin04bG0130500 [Pterospermum kingtungense]